MSNIWEVLGISPTTDKKEIRRAYSELVKEYHVEEHPEEFGKIQKAYQAALEYTKGQSGTVFGEQEISFAERENAVGKIQTKEREKSILAQLNEIYEQQESVCSKECVITQMTELLMKPQSADDSQCWQEFFLSDSFLTVYHENGFAEELIAVIEQYDAQGLLCITQLPPLFLKELALVYGIVNFHDMDYIQDHNKGAIAELLLQQDNSDWAITKGDAQLVNRSYSYYYFRKLCQLAGQGGLHDYQQKQWGNLTFYAKDEYVPDIPVEKAEVWHDQLELMIEPHAPTCVAMHRYLVKHYSISESICNRMRDNFEIDGRMGGYPLCSYEPVYEQMCLKYPQMKGSEAAKLTDWKRALLAEEPVFEKKKLNIEIMEWLMLLWQVRDFSRELTQEVYAAYEEEGEEALPLLEVLIGKLTSYENLPDRLPGLGCYEENMEISTQNRYFWSYFFSVAYPFSNDGRTQQEGDYHRNLSRYLNKVYPPSHRWNLQFCGTERTFLFGNKEIRLVFRQHHLEYFVDGEPVFYQTFSFKEIACLSENDEDIINFFLLLPITKISSPSKAAQEVQKRITRLPFYRPTWSYLAACLANNSDWETKPDHPQKVVEEVYYSENEWHCFKGMLTPRKFTVEYKTPDGWFGMKLLHGESKAARAMEKKEERLEFMHSVVDSYLPPKAQIKEVLPVAEKTSLQKAECIFQTVTDRVSRTIPREAKGRMPKTLEFINSRNLKNKRGDNVILWFGKAGEGSVAAMYYMCAYDWWDSKSTSLEIQGEEKNMYIKWEERLRRRVHEAVDVVGFFRVEGILPFPIGIGESGTFYSYFHHQLIWADSFPELMAHCIDFTELDRIQLNDGIGTVGHYVRKLECWYQSVWNQDIRDVEQNYPYEKFRELFKEL